MSKYQKLITVILFMLVAVLPVGLRANSSFDIPNYYTVTSTITITSGTATGYVVVPTGIKGQVVNAYISTPSLTSSATTTMRLSAATASATSYFWTSGTCNHNTTTRFIGASGTPQYGMIPENLTSTYWIADLSATYTTAATCTISITYTVWRNSPKYYYTDTTVTVADAGTRARTAIAKESTTCGDMVSAILKCPATTSEVTSTCSMKIAADTSTNYCIISGSVAASTLGTIQTVANNVNPVPIEFWGDTSPICYWEVVTAGTQSGAKTFHVYWVCRPKANEF